MSSVTPIIPMGPIPNMLAKMPPSSAVEGDLKERSVTITEFNNDDLRLLRCAFSQFINDLSLMPSKEYLLIDPDRLKVRDKEICEEIRVIIKAIILIAWSIFFYWHWLFFAIGIINVVRSGLLINKANATDIYEKVEKNIHNKTISQTQQCLVDLQPNTKFVEYLKSQRDLPSVVVKIGTMPYIHKGKPLECSVASYICEIAPKIIAAHSVFSSSHKYIG